MKLIYTVAICTALLTFASCGKDSNNPQHAANTITATLDSLSFSSTSNVALEVRIGANGAMAITGTDKDGNQLVIEFVYFLKGPQPIYGSGVLGGGGGAEVAFIPSGSADAFASIYFNASANGSAELTEIDTVNKIISGTFNTKMTNISHTKSIAVTNGTFTKIPYTVQNDKVTAKIDGQDFNAVEIIASAQDGELSVTAFGPFGSQLIGITVPLATGTYDATSFGTCSISYTTDVPTFYSSSGGSVTVTKVDQAKKIAEGTFSGTVSPFLTEGDDVVITNGTFSVGYQ